MTLKSYDSRRLDELSLRLLDVVCRLRQLADVSRKNPDEKLLLHDRKPLEWIARLERWAAQAQARSQPGSRRRRRAADSIK